MLRRLCMVPVAAVTLAACAAAQTAPEPRPLRSESRSTYLHRITLYDHDGKAIDPAEPDAPPYSPKATCSKCHEYGSISHGWHFNAFEASGQNGRSGEPWLLTDARCGVALPVSARGWVGSVTPSQAGLSPWDFILTFGRHLPGGGVGELDPEARDADPHARRWALSGPLEIDCMICHDASGAHDPAEIERQLERENLRWSATAALGLGVIRGDAKRLPEDFDPLSPPTDAARPPQVVYDRARFDADNRVFFDIARQPSAERCYFCHTVRETGDAAPRRWETPGDVHLAKGMNCAQCHRNGIDHMMTRGDGGGRHDRQSDPGAILTCVGCHLGDANDRPPTAGWYGAPRPEHWGIPPLHFERMTCTSCHAGPWPADHAAVMQTSLSHKLGIPTKDKRDGSPPTIAGPIFARDDAGRVAPFREVWPAYWGVQRDGAIAPIPIDAVRKVVEKIVPKPRSREIPPPLADEHIVAALEGFARSDATSPAVYVRDGLVHRLDRDGRLIQEPHSAVGPYRWALGHDVRPASQSLGVRGCTDCHADGAPLFFGVAGPATATQPARLPMHEVFGYDGALASRFADSMRLKPIAFWSLLGAVVVLVLAITAQFVDLLRDRGRTG